jgi:serine/threonine protein kinase
MALLVVIEGANPGRYFALKEDKSTIGRNADCDVVLNSPDVSKAHAVIRRIQGEHFIEDLQSSNGTWVNFRPVTARTPLKEMDRIKMGNYLVAFLEIDPPTAEGRGPFPPLLGDLRPTKPEVEYKPASEWQPGDCIEHRWEVQQVLGGGMGIVYVVLDQETGERLAAKTYRDDVLAAQPELPRRFEREALAWVNLDPHPNVVQAKYVKTIRDKPFLFLEFVEGENLRRVLPSLRVWGDGEKDAGEIYCSTIHDLLLQFCDGMIHIAKCGITAHRDIKPENCLVTKAGFPQGRLLTGIQAQLARAGVPPEHLQTGKEGLRLKITDFGLAKVFDSVVARADAPHIVRVLPERSSLASPPSPETVEEAPLREGLSVFATRTGVGAGTPTHMAPEQFDDVKRVDVRADVYSFGVMLYQLLTGRLPFTGRTWLDYKRLHQTMSPPKLSATLSSSPRRGDSFSLFVHVVDRCLAKDPSERFANFVELREALAGKCNHLEVTKNTVQ